MRLQLRTRNLRHDPSLSDHVRRRLHFALGRFDREVSTVLVRLEDVNGPRGGVDKRCTIDLHGTKVGARRVEVEDTDVVAAVDRAARTAARLVAATLERRRRGVGSPRFGADAPETWSEHDAAE